VPFIALTATAPPTMLKRLKQSLSLKSDCKIVSANPNRANIYLEKKLRLSNHHAYGSYDQILVPIANNLAIQRENYPMTIVYLKLKYCGYAYRLFEGILKDKQYSGNISDPVARLFAQFHGPQTKRMKKDIIHEIGKENSRIRVIFATSALGMGVDAPYVTRIIHITPPATVESYVQEIGRAGRTGLLSRAILYYNNSDIANNKKHVQDEMKTYCQSQQICLRQQILQYLGFSKVTQEKCCSVCEGLSGKVFSDVNEDQKPTKKFRMLAITNRAILEEKIYCEVLNKNQVKSEMFSIPSIEVDVVDKMMEGIEYIETESDLLLTYGIWDEDISSKIFGLISTYAPLI
jgi:superfamily II DNA helicase RecQ